MDCILPILLSITSLALGGGVIWLVFRAKLQHAEERGRAQRESERITSTEQLAASQQEVTQLAQHVRQRDEQLAETEKQLSYARAENAKLAEALHQEQTSVTHRLSVIRDGHARLSSAIQALASEALAANQQSLLELTKTALDTLRDTLEHDLDDEQQEVAEFRRLISESLDRMDTAHGQSSEDFVKYYRAVACRERCLRTELLSGLASITLAPLAQFPTGLLASLTTHLPIKAASFCCLSSLGTSLILQAQEGLDFRFYESFDLPLNTLAGQAVADHRTITCSDVSASPHFRDTKLVSEFGLTSMAAIPIPLPIQGAPAAASLPEAVVCIYPNSDADLNGLSQLLTDMSGFLGIVYLLCIERSKLALRSQAVHRIAISHDLNSSLHKLIGIIQSSLNIEAGSVFLLDKKSKLLRAHAVRPRFAGQIPKAEAIYKEGDDSDTWSVYENDSPVYYHNLATKANPPRYLEETASDATTAVLLPIRALQTPRKIQ